MNFAPENFHHFIKLCCESIFNKSYWIGQGIIGVLRTEGQLCSSSFISCSNSKSYGIMTSQTHCTAVTTAQHRTSALLYHCTTVPWSSPHSPLQHFTAPLHPHVTAHGVGPVTHERVPRVTMVTVVPHTSVSGGSDVCVSCGTFDFALWHKRASVCLKRAFQAGTVA